MVNGQKVWTSGADTREFGMLVARTDADVPKHRGITCFVVDMRSAGVDVRPLRQMNGAASFNEVFLTDVRVPADSVIGEVNGGWRVSLTTLANERAQLSSRRRDDSGQTLPLITYAKANGAWEDAAVLEELGLGAHARDESERRHRLGLERYRELHGGDASRISAAIKARGIDVVDVVTALARRGFTEEAENLLALVRLRLSGDYLQTSALIRDGRVLSAVNDPNDYHGPGSGYRVGPERRAELGAIRDVIDQREVLRSQAMFEKAEARRVLYRTLGPAQPSEHGAEVVIGVSPAFGSKLFKTLAGEPVSVVLRAVIEGIRGEGATARVVRMRHTADTSFLGLSAARLSGSGIGIGLQAKGTAVIHQAERLPHHNLELFSNAPITTLDHYRRLGANAAAYAMGDDPEPIVVPTRGEAMGARYHAEVALIYAIETGLCAEGAAPEELSVEFTGG